MLRKLFIITLLSGLILAACGGTATPASTGEAPPVVSDDIAVIAEGRLLPRDSVQLSFSAGGKVVEILAAEGAQVKADDVIARLENSEALQAQVAQAELELLNAQQALQALKDSAAMAAAQAQFAVAQAQNALTKAQKDLVYAQNPAGEGLYDSVSDTQLALDNAQAALQLSNVSPEVSAYQNAVFVTNWYRRQWEEAKAKYDSSNGAQDLKDAMDQAWNAYQSRLNDQNALQLSISTDQANKADQVAKAQEAHDQAVTNLNSALKGPQADKLALAQANVALAEATLKDAQTRAAKLQSGPDPDQLKLAEARISTAEAALTAAKAAFENSELRTPLAGSVADLNLEVGEQVPAGQPVATIADFSGWTVETDNLTEIDVVKIKTGQGASVVLDALPGVTLRGSVTEISNIYVEQRGDITYKVTLALADQDLQMRWGMTAQVTFDK
jgi:multidrug efflux pump subunit AcrA (membrane-fusion protein)